MDRHSKKQRRRNMQAVKSKGSKIEIMLAKAMWRKGLRYRKNNKMVFGKPDFTFKKYKVAVFCDSEFWHGKNWKQKKYDHKSNIEFWHKKIERNIERDKEVNKELTKTGWKVIRFWGKEIETYVYKCVVIVEKAIHEAKINMSRENQITFEEIFNQTIKKKWSQFSEDGEAAFSHYIHSCKNNISNLFRKEAIYHVKHALEYKLNHKPVTFKIAEKALQYMLFDLKVDIPFPAPVNPKFTFIDLFAGIGGFRIALQQLGGKCVFTSEWDEQAKITYQANFGEIPFGDITKPTTKKFIPAGFDVLCAGFPCQAFSMAGRRGGFEDTRGTLFFDTAEIIKQKKPKAIFLENVKGLVSHDRGKTLNTILNVLRHDLGYFVPEPEILNAKDFGLPQNRERIYIVGFRGDLGVKSFHYPKPMRDLVSFKDVKEEQEVSVKYYLSETYLKTLINHKQRHENKGNGFGFEIIPDEGVANAVVCGGMGRERNLVYDYRLKDFTPVTHIKGLVNKEGIRKMTPREWARLQGFPDKFIIPVADASAYKQFGNSVAVPAIKATAKEMIKRMI